MKDLYYEDQRMERSLRAHSVQGLPRDHVVSQLLSPKLKFPSQQFPDFQDNTGWAGAEITIEFILDRCPELVGYEYS